MPHAERSWQYSGGTTESDGKPHSVPLWLACASWSPQALAALATPGALLHSEPQVSRQCSMPYPKYFTGVGFRWRGSGAAWVASTPRPRTRVEFCSAPASSFCCCVSWEAAGPAPAVGFLSPMRGTWLEFALALAVVGILIVKQKREDCLRLSNEKEKSEVES